MERTDDGRHVVIDGRRWRATDPTIPEDRRRELVAELMSARRAVAAAKRSADSAAESEARRRVHAEAAAALAERGEISVTQRGEPVDARTARGPIRLGSAN